MSDEQLVDELAATTIQPAHGRIRAEILRRMDKEQW